MDGQNIIHRIECIRRQMDEGEPNDTHVSIEREDLEAFLNQYNLLHTICESIPDGIFVKDREGRVIMSNAVGPRNIGKSVEEVLGKDAFGIFSPDTARQTPPAGPCAWSDIAL